MLQGNYDPKEAEPRWLKYWEQNRIYSFDQKDTKRPIFSIDTPPPTVSGKMHIGHAFSYTQHDFVARYKRMRGFNLFFPFGTDDNGLATERLIEKMKNVRSKMMERRDFINLCLKTLEDIRPGFIQDWKNIGFSADYSIFYSTINDHCRKISQWSFIDLYKKGREYQKESPTIWCPSCQTAIAQVELEDAEQDSFFNDVKFKLEDGKDLIIATTRPELLPACVAIFFHPNDKRYKMLEGKNAIVPLFGQKVKIMSDKRVDPEKGTGIVMNCTFGDLTDIEWYKAYKLPLRAAIAKDGKLTELAGKYAGMKVKEARKAIIEDLKASGQLVNQKPIKHVVNVHERCKTDVEFMNTKQWFIKYLDLKDEFLKLGKKLKWYPDYMRVRYENWIKGLQWDWTISRQRYFGVPFPVWYCKKCSEVILASESQLPVDPLIDKPSIKKCPKCGNDEFEPEKDVLDTWATSSLTPQLAIELMKGKPTYDKLYPMSLRPQAHDIITFWLFNTVVKSHLHYDKLPWKDTMISGYVLDSHGEKMSKSVGNVIEPQDIMKKYSADALRFFAAGSKLGDDTPYQEKDLVTGQKTITKLWNAAKFCFVHLQDFDGKAPKKLELMDRWLLSKLHKVIKEATDAFENYEYAASRRGTEQLFWKDFCDYYLEIIKDRIYNPDRRGQEARKSAQYALYQTLLNILKLFAPVMPFITEEIYQSYFAEKEKKKSIHLSDWPTYDKRLVDKSVEEAGEAFVAIVATVRKFKSERNLSLVAPIKKLIIASKKHEKALKEAVDDLKATLKAENIQFSGAADIEVAEDKDIKIGIEL